MSFDTVRPLHADSTGIRFLDQRRLPEQVSYVTCAGVDEVIQAIRDMVVRGAPAIGIAAAWGAVLAARDAWAGAPDRWRERMAEDLERLRLARPTAVNLAWALARMEARAWALDAARDPTPELAAEAEAIHEEDVQANRRMGRSGASLIAPGSGVLTHCNTGSLATGGFGTALGVIRTAWADGRLGRVFVGETRPWLQGARLTAWELIADGISTQVLVDSAAALLMRRRHVQWVVVGADRIAANGDVANKVGTYTLALAARHHDVRVMVVAPSSTVDMETPDGDAIPLETRSPDEVLCLGGQRVAAEGADAWNPVFDITPASLVDALVTEHGVIHRPDRALLEERFG